MPTHTPGTRGPTDNSQVRGGNRRSFSTGGGWTCGREQAMSRAGGEGAPGARQPVMRPRLSSRADVSPDAPPRFRALLGLFERSGRG